ncbi:alternative ribosome rescue aminoacyl-tRNA hydrolase ArfB [Ferrovibrio sp.]|uniref:alternative ribosome rescue aminoacyl-tRNA hydrolase ArfB n=1 Tax=Ferrovibrio sp. TaxID=1917215 RepID=UPI00311D6A9B
MTTDSTDAGTPDDGAPDDGAPDDGDSRPQRIHVTGRIALDPREIAFSFIRASGPGGQNVNKVATAVQLRFDVRRSPALPDAVRMRLETLAGSRLTREGVLVLTAQQHRSQERNRQDALDRLLALIRQAAAVPKTRRPTRPTLGSKKRRLEAKGQRSATKSLRRVRQGDE